MYPEGLEFGTGVNSWISLFSFLQFLPPAPLPFSGAFRTTRLYRL